MHPHHFFFQNKPSTHTCFSMLTDNNTEYFIRLLLVF